MMAKIRWAGEKMESMSHRGWTTATAPSAPQPLEGTLQGLKGEKLLEAGGQFGIADNLAPWTIWHWTIWHQECKEKNLAP